MENRVYTNRTSSTDLEPLWHVSGADLVVLVGHVTALQLAGLVQLKDALPPLPPLGLLLGPVPALFILILLFLFALVIGVCVKVGKVKVSAKNLLGLLEGSGKQTEKSVFILSGIPDVNLSHRWIHFIEKT